MKTVRFIYAVLLMFIILTGCEDPADGQRYSKTFDPGMMLEEIDSVKVIPVTFINEPAEDLFLIRDSSEFDVFNTLFQYNEDSIKVKQDFFDTHVLAVHAVASAGSSISNVSVTLFENIIKFYYLAEDIDAAILDEELIVAYIQKTGK